VRYPNVAHAQVALDELAKRFQCKTENPRSEAPPRVEAPGPGRLPDDDAELLRRAFAADNGARFSRCWTGENTDYHDDVSAGDLGLCSMLAFWAGPNGIARVDALFQRSGRMRPKWHEKHRADGATYGAMTLKRACVCT